MKKIISGRKYDTDTAAYLGSYEHDFKSSFKWYMEDLYRKKTGEFFIYGEGHAASPYAQSSCDGCFGPGEAIRPLSYEEAQAWAEKHLSTDKYEEIFGEVSEDESRTTLSVSMASSTAEAARREAAKRGISLSAYLESLILADRGDAAD